MTDDWEQPGSKLRAAREAKGMAIADVSHRTRIPARVIEALEQDDYGSFPSPTYAKSFLAQYAEFVNVDSSRWMDFFEPVPFTGPDDVLSIVDAPDPHHHHQRHHDSKPVVYPANRSHGLRSTILLILLTGGICYACIKVWPVIEKKYGEVTEQDKAQPLAPGPAPQGGKQLTAPSGPSARGANSPENPPAIAAKPPTPTRGEPEIIPRAIPVRE